MITDGMLCWVCCRGCSSRKGTMDAAAALVRDAEARARVGPQTAADTGSVFVKSLQQLQRLQSAAVQVQAKALGAALVAGVGFHHAAMEPADRAIVEELFKENNLSVSGWDCCIIRLLLLAGGNTSNLRVLCAV